MSSLPTITSQDATFIDIASKLAIEGSVGKLKASMEKIKEYLKSMEDMIDNGFRNIDLCLPTEAEHESAGKTVLSMLLQMVRVLAEDENNDDVDPTKEPGSLFKPLIKKLVQLGADCDVNVVVDDDGNASGETPFWLAAELGLLDVVKEMLLIKRVKYIDVYNSDGFAEPSTALYQILTAVDLWIEKDKGEPILATMEKIEISIALAKELVQLGSDCDMGPMDDNKKCMTSLFKAASIGNLELISLMLSMGAKDHTASNTDEGINVIDCLIENARKAADKEEEDKVYQFLQFIGQLLTPGEKFSHKEMIAWLLKYAETFTVAEGQPVAKDTYPYYWNRKNCFL